MFKSVAQVWGVYLGGQHLHPVGGWRERGRGVGLEKVSFELTCRINERPQSKHTNVYTSIKTIWNIEECIKSHFPSNAPKPVIKP